MESLPGTVMKHLYADVEHRATASLMFMDDGTTAILTGIEVNRRYRGHGYASALLKEVLADADAEGMTLLLSVSPDGSERSLAYDELEAWYERYGFRYVGVEQHMQRSPSSD